MHGACAHKNSRWGYFNGSHSNETKMETTVRVCLGKSRNIVSEIFSYNNSFNHTAIQRSSRGAGNFSVFAKVEFKNESLGESSRHELLEGSSDVNMDLSVLYSCSLSNIESIIKYPMISKQWVVLVVS